MEDAISRILCVDDEAHVLAGLERVLSFDFDVTTALSGAEGLERLKRDGPFEVVVSDMRMPQMDGAAFLSHVRAAAPDTVRVLLTGQADMDSAIAAVNEGQIFRFLTKPCPLELLVRTLRAAVKQHRLITSERVLLRETLKGSINVLTEVLSIVNPSAFGRASRIKSYVKHVATKLGLPDLWQYELAAMLSQIGCVTLPPDVLDKVHAGQTLSGAEQRVFDSHPAVAEKLIGRIPRLGAVARMVGRQHQSCQAPASGDDRSVAVGATILQTALDFDRLVARGAAPEAAIAALRKKASAEVAGILTALEDAQLEAGESILKTVRVREMDTFMTLEEDVRTTNGVVVVCKAHEVTTAVLERLRRFAEGVGVVEPIRVRVRRAAA